MRFADEHRNSWLQQQEAYSKQFSPTCANRWLKYRQRGGYYAHSPDGQSRSSALCQQYGDRDDEERGSAAYDIKAMQLRPAVGLPMLG